MSVKRYYRFALALPLLVPALLSPLISLEAGPQALRLVLFVLYWSVVIGGVPYLLFAAGFLLWMRDKPDASVRGAVLLSPLLYSVVLLACFALFLMVDGALRSSSDSFGMIAVCAVVVGYLYVGVAELGRALLRPGAAPAGPTPAEPAPAA